MKTIKLLILTVGLLCAVALATKANPKPEDFNKMEKFQEVKVNTSFGAQTVSVNNNMINLYKTFQMQTGYVSIRDLVSDFTKSSLLKSWSTYQVMEVDEQYPANRKFIMKESL